MHSNLTVEGENSRNFWGLKPQRISHFCESDWIRWFFFGSLWQPSQKNSCNTRIFTFAEGSLGREPHIGRAGKYGIHLNLLHSEDFDTVNNRSRCRVWFYPSSSVTISKEI